MILDSISRRFVVVLNLQNNFPAGSFPRENWLHFFSFFSTALSFSFKFHWALNFLAFCELDVVVVVALLFYVHGKHLRSCRDGQLTYPHFSWAGLDLLSG